jgi:predicted O-methyltransferase YrrM
MPLRVRWFLWRTRRLARRMGHDWGLRAATRPRDVSELLRLARGRRRVVELGTGPGWTAIALALADPERRVVTYDPVEHEHRAAYLALAARTGDRIEWVAAEGASGAATSEDPVDLLFIDSTHEREPTLAEFRAWRSRLAPDAVVAFHDYGHPDFPGVAEAVDELGLEGERRGGMFVWRRAQDG